MDIYLTLGYASAFSVGVPVTAGIIRFKSLSRSLKILSWFLFLSVIVEVLLFYTNSKGINNLVIMNVFNLVEFTFFSLVFRKAFASYIIRKGIVAALLCFTAFALLDLFFMQGMERFNSWTMGLENLLVMLITLLFLYEVFRKGKVQRLERHPMFWVASGALLYFAGNFFLFILINYALAESNIAYVQWGGIHSCVNLVANLCYALGIWLSPGS